MFNVMIFQMSVCSERILYKYQCQICKVHKVQRGNMRQKWVSLAVILMVLFAGLLPTLGDASTSTSLSRVKICFKNCGQCKRMLGDYFDGRRCADHCISQKGRFIPDCHDIFSISAFLSKLDY
ncbi:Eclosion hormone [Folsomia candida]|uniref:Eclosion hormone n=1 Tax=Folsomia candida TaxID=158441 RepID=A0A226EMI8_FOLCA|nr:Eclosion hormone [Folsomia candida]